MAHPEHPDHYTYLLSLWQEGRSWRAALRPADGGPRLGFGDLDQLMVFLLRLQGETEHQTTQRTTQTGCPPLTEPRKEPGA